MADCALYRRRLAGTELFVYVYESIGAVLGLILLEDSLSETLVIAVDLEDLLIRALLAESSDECGQRDLSVFIYTNVNNVV